MDIELTSPAGSYESLAAAINAGADSIYFGVEQLNMRARGAKKLEVKDISKIAKICHKHNVKCYLALNVLVYDSELKEMEKLCNAAKKALINGIIATDISTIKYARSIGLIVHLSTQVNVSNVEALKYYSKYADVIVLARELSLGQIKDICKAIKKEKIKGPGGALVKIEVFIHGALCVSIAGKCYMSLAAYNHAANRGDCLQNCRRAYRVIDDETGDELLIENKYVMSPKDLCTIDVLDIIIGAGVSVLKIEGRARGPEYVYAVTKVYREAVESIKNGTFSKEKTKAWEKDLLSVFNRGFWKGGYYLGNKLGEWADSYGSKATKEKKYVGYVLNYYAKNGIAHFMIETGTIKVGDNIMMTGPTTGVIFSKAESIFKDKPLDFAKKGDDITIPVPMVRKNDKLYVMRDRK